jgi:ABC-type amino acid transport substrate-binding protein
MDGLRDPRRRRFLAHAAAAAACTAARPLRAEEPAAMARIRARGSLVVGLYRDMPPFHVGGAGIDVEVARALAAQLGLGLSLLPFTAGESMDDDLRNMVWRGHYLGWGPADVLLHVPVERALMAGNPKVQVVAPYYRERVAIAYRRDAVPALPSLAALRGRRVAVAGRSLAGWLLIGTDDGALAASLSTDFPDGAAAAQALRDGTAVAAAGLASELESVLARDDRFAIEPLPAPRAPHDGWAVGCAVKKEANDLAAALQEAMKAVNLAAIFDRAGVRWRL